VLLAATTRAQLTNFSDPRVESKTGGAFAARVGGKKKKNLCALEKLLFKELRYLELEI